MNSSGPGPDQISRAAAAWLARRDRGLTPVEQEEFRAWQALDPRHGVEFARLEGVWLRYDGVRSSPVLQAMTAQLDRRAAKLGTKRRSRRLWYVGLAAAAAIAVGVGLGWQRLADAEKASSTPSYAVLAGSGNRLQLEDGSIAVLRADSEIRSEFTPAERRVVLVRGEAHFSVTKNPARPFIVQAGGASVRAVGTAFNVRLGAQKVEVLVTEGTVQVTDRPPPAATAATPVPAPAAPLPLVTAGERAVLDREPAPGASPRIAVRTAAPAEIEQTLGWQSTRLVFDRTPLPVAVDAFNRYTEPNEGVRLIIADPALADRRLGGTFRTTNVDGFVRLLEQSADVRVERREGEIILRSAR